MMLCSFLQVGHCLHFVLYWLKFSGPIVLEACGMLDLRFEEQGARELLLNVDSSALLKDGN